MQPAGYIIHLRGTFDKAPLTLCRKAIGVAIVMERHASRLFGKGARPGGLIESPKPIGQEGAKAMIAGWKLAMEGSENSGKTGILWDGATWKQMTLSSVDAQFQQLRLFQLQEIARAFNIPASLIGDLTRATWSNSAEMQRQFLQLCLEPWLRALESALGCALFTKEEKGKFAIRFDRDDFTNVDLTARATAISSLVSSRVINPNTARSWLDLPPYDGGEEYAKRASAASREAGAYATEQERQRVIALTEAIHKEEEAKALTQDRTLLYRDLTSSALDDVFSGVEQNKSAFEIMADVAVNSLKRIADTLTDDVLDSIFQVNNAAGGSGGGLFGGLLSGVFGGGAKADPWAGMRMPSFDGGGHTGMGARTGGLDGKGGFLAMMHPRETVTDHTRPGSSSGGSQLVTVKSDVRVSVDNNGNLKAFVERTSQEISARTSGDMITQFSREALPGRVNEISQDPRAVG